MNYSFTQNGNWKVCKRRWLLRHGPQRLRAWVPTSWQMEFGSVLHKIMEVFPFPYQDEENPGGEQELREEWERLFKASVKKLEGELYRIGLSRTEKKTVRGNLERFSGLGKKGLAMLIRHYRKSLNFPLPWKREDKFSFGIAGYGVGIEFWLRLDRLLRDGTIEDIKTGRVKKSAVPKEKEQLLCYRVGVQSQYKFPWRCENRILRLQNHTFIAVKLRRKDWEALRFEIAVNASQIAERLERLRRGEDVEILFPKIRDEEVCEGCGFYFPCQVRGLWRQETMFSLPDLVGVGRRTIPIRPPFELPR